MTSSTNEGLIRRKKNQQSRDRITDELVTRSLMTTVEGRRWVWLRLSEAHMFAEEGGLDPYWMAYEKGQRRAGLRLLKDVQMWAPSEYILMSNEAQTIEASINAKDPNYVGSEHDE